MINPHQIEPKYKRVNNPRFAGGHYYMPLVGHFTRRSFRRASEAETYAKRVHARWCRLYDAAVVEMMENAGQETSVEQTTPEPAGEPTV
jgi:hypothetical protein